ncbi:MULTISPECIES: hypothetical protein [unclassified Phycicoccus]|uniref:hypothetical protein n=1 Tax=unclassified Phycicoccus TaxID=2637926 RepID=UPI0007030D84|nr:MULTISPECIES: hypothetical protein [unclassified Phycicoccus]KQU70322.1 hypothetical protein ASC58_00380 [Phycicoccus sp. Root101]KQZ88615.1 hypothetical protein ASD62_04150 [Phycicoccus sp. Root563]
MGDKDVDAQFADIVAHWDDVESLPDKPHHSGVNPPLEPDTHVNPPPTRPFVVWRGAEVEPPPVTPEPEQDTPPAELVDLDDEEHFEPGPTAPLPPQEDLHFWGIVVGLVVGPLLVLWLVLFRPQVSGWWTLAAVVLTVGGFVLLVLRQPHDRDEHDPDNGARV